MRARIQRLGLPADTLVGLLRERSRIQPDRAAYSFLADGEHLSETITYLELTARVQSFAGQISKLVAPGDRVLLLYPSGIDFIVAFFACLFAGAVAVPAYPPRNVHKMGRIQSIVLDCQPGLALTTTENLPVVRSWLEQHPEFQPLTAQVEDRDEVVPFAEGDRVPRPDGLALLQYTSGSTSTPKGVMVTHANLLYNCAYITAAHGLSPDTVSVSWLPVYHDMGLIDGIINPIVAGYPAYLMSPVAFLQKPLRWLEAISRYRATHSGAPNFAYELCLRKGSEEQRGALDLSRWTTAYNGAEPVRVNTLERFSEAYASAGFRPTRHYPCYGLAEATLMVTGGDPSTAPALVHVSKEALEAQRIVEVPASEVSKPLVACGRVRMETEVAIVHPEAFRRCAPDEIGEIWVSGPTVARGYWQRPEETERTFRARLADVPERAFLRTGDLGFVKDGELYVTGRLKDLLVIGGRNHYPQDLELTVENCHPSIRAGCVAAFSIEVENEERLVVVAEVERRHRSFRKPPTEGNLEAMEGRLDSFEAAPRALLADEVVDCVLEAVAREHELPVYAVGLLMAASIPKTSSGKIQGQACKRGFLNRELKLVGEWPMRGASLG